MSAHVHSLGATLVSLSDAHSAPRARRTYNRSLYCTCIYLLFRTKTTPHKPKMSAAKIALLAALAAVTHAADDDTIGFGPAFSLGPTQSWIREANTTIVLPAVPSPQVDRLALWPGMGTSGGDLIQALAVSFTDPGANCDGATSGQWCIWASTLQGTQLGGKMVPADAGDSVTMHCRFCKRRRQQLAGGPAVSGRE